MGVAKYGRGLGIEFAEAVRTGRVKEPFGIRDVRAFANSRGWNPPDTYINVLLANSSAETHSPTYRKLFVSLGEGMYALSDLARKSQ
jgi:hypothetical protein